MRHAQAHTVELTLAVEGKQLRLTISDDGVGFIEAKGARCRSAWSACVSAC